MQNISLKDWEIISPQKMSKKNQDPFDHFENLGDLKEIKVYKGEIPCWKCKNDTPRVSYSFCYKFNYSIGNVKKLDEILLREYPFVKKTFSKTRGEEVIGNICIHCGSLQRNWFIMEELSEIVYDYNMDNLIDKKIRVNLTEKDLVLQKLLENNNI